MKRERLSEALNEISDAHIAEAAAHKHKPRAVWIGAVAAVLAIAILVGITPRPDPDEPVADVPGTPAFDVPAADAPAADAPVADMSSILNGVSLLASHFEAIPTYPKMGKYDGYDWGPYIQGHKEQYNQPEGYAAGSEVFFRSSIQQLLLSQEENQVYSPLNVYMALTMLAETTAGDSRQQLLTLLGSDSIESLRTQAGHMWNAHYCDDGVSVSVLGNSLWLDEDYSFSDDTLATLADNYYAAVYQGDLGSDETNHILHRWINLLTGGLLQEQANQFNLQPESVLGLVSTVYYNACWTDEFYEGSHTQAVFHTPTGDVETTFMNQSATRDYFWGEDFSAVSLPLQDSGRMWLILPEEGSTPAQIVESGYALDLVLGNSASWENQSFPLVHLSLPKFDVVADTDMIEPLQQLGVTDIFRSDLSDFSSLVQGEEQPFITQMLHAARVSIDEQGVTGAAFTAADAVAAEAPEPEEELSFVLDRPFLFIVESRDGIPLFTGIVNTP